MLMLPLSHSKGSCLCCSVWNSAILPFSNIEFEKQFHKRMPQFKPLFNKKKNLALWPRSRVCACCIVLIHQLVEGCNRWRDRSQSNCIFSDFFTWLIVSDIIILLFPTNTSRISLNLLETLDSFSRLLSFVLVLAFLVTRVLHCSSFLQHWPHAFCDSAFTMN